MLLDVMMPEMNGYEVLEQLKADERLRHLPVIMISAVDQVESVIRCVELGAEDYLQKPFNPTLLRARVGASLEKKRLRDELVAHLARVELELQAAREIQLGMVPVEFPQAPPPAHLDVHAALYPAREIGGDLYDFFYSDPQTLCVAIADVAGKGAPAALFMARTKTLVRMVATLLPGASGPRPRPDEVVARVNIELCRDNASLIFVTLFFAMLDLPSRTLSYCNAGHNLPYVIDTAGAVAPVDRGARQAARHPARTSPTPPPPAPSPPAIACTSLPTGSPRRPMGRSGSSRSPGSRRAFARRPAQRRGRSSKRRSPGYASSSATRRSRTTSPRWRSGWCDEAAPTGRERHGGPRPSARTYRDGDRQPAGGAGAGHGASGRPRGAPGVAAATRSPT